MRAVAITSPGGPDVLGIADVPDPVPAPGEVLIEITASGVNRADLLQRQGLYPPPPGAPPYPGLECSGTIAAVGEGVTGWQVGEQVCALLSGGGYAEKVAAPAGQLLPVPDGLSVAEAASLPEVVGDAARLFDPTDPRAIAAAVRDVLDAPAEWSARGLERAAQFTWERTARATEDVYRELL